MEDRALIWMDLTHPIGPETPVYPGDPPVTVQRLDLGEDGAGCTVYRLALSTHSGTHVDTPAHLWSGGVPLGGFPLGLWLGPARLVEHAEVRGLGPGLPPRLLVRGCPDGLTPEEAKHVADVGIGLLGIDGPGVDPMGSNDLPAHRILLGAGIPVVEQLVLEKVPRGPGWLACLPLPVTSGDGAPVRALWSPGSQEDSLGEG